MKSSLTRTATALLVGMAIVFLPPTAEAQFLKRIQQGLEQVEKVTKRQKEKKAKKEKEKKEKTAPEARQGAPSAQAAAPSAPSASVRTPATPAEIMAKVPNPYFTTATRFVGKNLLFDNLQPVSEGIFGVMEYNRDIGYASYWGFWTVEGECIFPSVYEQFGDRPRFNSGACVVKIPNSRPECPVILYADGHIKKLNHEWKKITQFYDGVAMVGEYAPKGITLFYINTKGERIWPHLTYRVPLLGGSAVLRMRPLKEGLRAFYSNADKKWGYLDAKGNVAIKPQFSDVRDFANGYALVFVPRDPTSGTPVFINTKGERVVDVPSSATTLQYATTITDVCDGIFSVSDGYSPTTYYDLKGNKLKEYAGGGSGFADGIAFVEFEKYSADQVYNINRHFNIVGKWPFVTSEFPNNKPVFTESPYFTFNRWVAIDPEGQPLVKVRNGFAYNEELGAFSADGYAPVKVEYKHPATGEQITYTGYVDISGHLKVVFSETAGAGGPFSPSLPGPKPPIEPYIPGPGDPEPPIYGGLPPYNLTPGKTTPRGPLDNDQKVLYEVKVVASPSEGGVAYGSGKYEYGDTIRVTGKASEGWKISEIECDRPASYTATFNKFVVRAGSVETTH